MHDENHTRGIPDKPDLPDTQLSQANSIAARQGKS